MDLDNYQTPWVDKRLFIPAKNKGSLDKKTFAVKDIFTVKGHQNTLGIPDLRGYTKVATENAPVIETLLNNGASLQGVTITDELMFSITGSNSFYGAPMNFKYLKRYSGGSSSGSASAVAGNLVDFALGSDTGGSTRVPASYCGIYGIRPSYSRELLKGVYPMAKDFDTVGVLARSSSLLAEVGNILYGYADQKIGEKVFILMDLFDLMDQQISEKLEDFIKQIFGNNYSKTKLPNRFQLNDLVETYRYIQGKEVWQQYGEWITKHHPNIGKDVKERLEFAENIDEKQVEYQKAIKTFNEFRDFFRGFLVDKILLFPTTPTAAPLKNESFSALRQVRKSTLKFTVLNSISGLPQVNIPVAINGKGYGLSITGGYKTDRTLLKFVNLMMTKKNEVD